MIMFYKISNGMAPTYRSDRIERSIINPPLRSTNTVPPFSRTEFPILYLQLEQLG